MATNSLLVRKVYEHGKTKVQYSTLFIGPYYCYCYGNRCQGNANHCPFPLCTTLVIYGHLVYQQRSHYTGDLRQQIETTQMLKPLRSVDTFNEIQPYIPNDNWME